MKSMMNLRQSTRKINSNTSMTMNPGAKSIMLSTKHPNEPSQRKTKMKMMIVKQKLIRQKETGRNQLRRTKRRKITNLTNRTKMIMRRKKKAKEKNDFFRFQKYFLFNDIFKIMG